MLSLFMFCFGSVSVMKTSGLRFRHVKYEWKGKRITMFNRVKSVGNFRPMADSEPQSNVPKAMGYYSFSCSTTFKFVTLSDVIRKIVFI